MNYTTIMKKICIVRYISQNNVLIIVLINIGLLDYIYYIYIIMI